LISGVADFSFCGVRLFPKFCELGFERIRGSRGAHMNAISGDFCGTMNPRNAQHQKPPKNEPIFFHSFSNPFCFLNEPCPKKIQPPLDFFSKSSGTF